MVNEHTFTHEVIISGTREDVFVALTQNVQQWWGYTDKAVSAVGDEFTTSFDQTFWKFRISEFKTHSRLVWKCIDARHIHNGYEGIEKEWIGTSVEWTLGETNSKGQTLVNFRHNGLIPELNCYEICTPAWEMFVGTSLKAFVETGQGSPSLQ